MTYAWGFNEAISPRRTVHSDRPIHQETHIAEDQRLTAPKADSLRKATPRSLRIHCRRSLPGLAAATGRCFSSWLATRFDVMQYEERSNEGGRQAINNVRLAQPGAELRQG